MPAEGEIAGYNGIVPIGRAMQGMGAIVVDTGNKEVPDNEKGELCLYGSQLTAGYLDLEKSKAAFLNINGKRYYRTGDIVYKNEAGDFLYCGRTDNQVKIQGYRIELSEIEFHLRDIVKSANVALAVNNAKGMTEIHIVFEGPAVNTDIILNELKAKVPSYMMPAQVHNIPVFPLNGNGKTDRKALQEKFTAI